MKIKIPKKNCINCRHFCWWDGDYCCTRKARLLLESPDGKLNKNIFMALQLNKDCNEHEDYQSDDYVNLFNNFLKENNYEISES